MPRGHEDQLFREHIRAYVNRKNGAGSTVYPVPTTAALFGHLLGVIALDELPASYFTNPDGSLWTPQNPDGSFQFLPGLDGPVTS